MDRELQLSEERFLVDRIAEGLLPRNIVDRLKLGEDLIADWRPMACVMFMDIVGFTSISDSMSAKELVTCLMKGMAFTPPNFVVKN